MDRETIKLTDAQRISLICDDYYTDESGNHVIFTEIIIDFEELNDDESIRYSKIAQRNSDGRYFKIIYTEHEDVGIFDSKYYPTDSLVIEVFPEAINKIIYN